MKKQCIWSNINIDVTPPQNYCLRLYVLLLTLWTTAKVWSLTVCVVIYNILIFCNYNILFTNVPVHLFVYLSACILYLLYTYNFLECKILCIQICICPKNTIFQNNKALEVLNERQLSEHTEIK
jgi:hypothetical protein